MSSTKFRGYNDKTYVLSSSGLCAMYFLVAFCLVFLIASLASIAIVIWLFIEADFLEIIASSSVFKAAIAMWICGGILLFFTAIFGLIGSWRKSRTILKLFIIFMALLILCLVVVGVLAFIFRGELDEESRGDMISMIQHQYGVRDATSRTKAVTKAWDRVQIFLDCCGVDKLGFDVYRESKWYAEQPGIVEARKPFVPVSCCAQNQYKQYINVEKCQLYKEGPPGQSGGSANEALNVRGCYHASKQYVKERTDIVAGFGFALAASLIIGLLCGIVLFINLKRAT